MAGDELAVLILDEGGRIRHCNPAGESLFKYSRQELVWRPVSLLLPQLAEMDLMSHGRINPRLRFLSRIGRRFQGRARDGEWFHTEIFVNTLGGADSPRLSLIVRPAGKASDEELPTHPGVAARPTSR